MTDPCQCALCRAMGYAVEISEADEEGERLKIRNRLAAAKFAADNGIKAPPAEEHGNWKDFLPDGDG